MDIRELGQEYCSLLDDEDSGDLHKDDKERLEELRKLNEEMYDALYYYNTADVMVIKADHIEDYTEEYISEVLGIDFREHSLNWYFDFTKYWEDNIGSDWDEIEWEGEKYMYRAW